MTKEELSQLVKRLRIVYRKDDGFIKDKESFELWYELLSDLRFDVCRKAVDEYIKKEKYPPTIADIRREYDSLWDDYMTMVRHINEHFDGACSYWPGVTDEERARAKKIFDGIVGKAPKENRERVAGGLAVDAVDYVKQVEASGSETIITFDEYMRQVVDEHSS